MSNGRNKCPSCNERNKYKITTMAGVGQQRYMERRADRVGDLAMIMGIWEKTTLLKSEDWVGVS